MLIYTFSNFDLCPWGLPCCAVSWRSPVKSVSAGLAFGHSRFLPTPVGTNLVLAQKFSTPILGTYFGHARFHTKHIM